ncbi:MAG: hypothetical protein V4580_07195 [Bacteroidota bacterium]
MMLVFVCSFSLKAQQNLFPSHHLLSFNYNNPSQVNQRMILLQPYNLQKQLPAISSGSINDLPFFCAMECRVRKHTNIWIKLRAGDDTSYMKMIAPSK